MAKYTKKPVTIEAMQLTKENVQEVLTWCNSHGIIASSEELSDELIGVSIRTLEGTMLANINDYIIKGVKGEFYPCKPDIFKATYNEATDKRWDAETAIELLEMLENNDKVLNMKMNLSEGCIEFLYNGEAYKITRKV